MPRTARIDAPGALHHIIVRGIEKKSIFRDDRDRSDYLNRIEKVFTETSTACFAWSLMNNHTHFLVRTGKAPIATVMRRLLTGYAVSFNLRHRRHGQLFQNRYKSFLCQDDPYLLELTRYIHLNPLRAGIVTDMESLDCYPFSGHSVLMGNQKLSWQSTDPVLAMFGAREKTARRKYREFVQLGISAGRRPELVGGGLIRSAGGWKAAKESLKGQGRVKGDERILGSGEFVEDILAQCDEQFERRYKLKAQGIGYDELLKKIAKAFACETSQIIGSIKTPRIVQARSVFCYLAVRELGLAATAIAKQMGITQPAVSISVRRAEQILKERRLKIEDFV